MPPKNAADVIREAASTGASVVGIRHLLKCSYEVFNRWLKEFPELQEALDQGREAERRTLHNVLFETAVHGEGRDKIIAAMFLLKARHGYIEGEQPQQASRVQINFAIPGARPYDPSMVIENGTDDPVKRLPNPGTSRA